MANIIDALLVTLGLDTSEYEKGTEKAEKSLSDFDKKKEASDKKRAKDDKKASQERDKQFKNQRDQTKATAADFNKLRNQIVGVMVAFTAGKGLIDFARDAMMGAASVGRLSENSGMAVETISGLEQAMKRIGGSGEEARTTVGNLSQELAKYNLGMESSLGEYLRFGGDFRQGEMKDTYSLLLGMADTFERLNKANPADAWMKASRMGISENMFNLLKQGRQAVKDQIADGAKLTGITKEQADSARQAQKAWADLISNLESVGKAILFPILKEISGWMEKHKDDITRWIGKLREAVGKFSAGGMEKFIGTLERIGELLENIVKLAEKVGLIKPEATEERLVDKLGNAGTHPAMMVKKMYDLWSMKGQAQAGASSKVDIGQVTINTQAKDANGIAAGMRGALDRHMNLTTQAASGVN